MASLPTHSHHTAPAHRTLPRRLQRRRQAAGPPRCRALAALICAVACLSLHVTQLATAAPAPVSDPLDVSSRANDTERVLLNESTAAWNRSLAPPAAAASAPRRDTLVDLPVAAAAGANPPPITPTATDATTVAPVPDKTAEPEAPAAPTEPSGPGPDAASSSSDTDAPARTSNSDASPYWTVVVPSVTGGAVLITLGIVYLVRRKAEHRESDMGEPLEWTGLA
ncbi:hypothetical protein AMAG_04760 [Allomyces macrogynus ATCC 38327]|uniref:Uncharacterized protein n=1 Tax=Allomyces macrogynus (strain ATCC 38327) TaxID=578462 RepID=A0A0L0S6C9_ALLM3|nr:hypothetical protein AMAG_04760 [Allomyces macrogynus ATCC 38327]|eukprot:KNE57919.1 hypothetical protein AMAG_04760 [Allomyces macrogynus ATCC 38327]